MSAMPHECHTAPDPRFSDLAAEASAEWSSDAKALHGQALKYFEQAARSNPEEKVRQAGGEAE